MKKILHVCCSPRGRAAESYRLSQKVIQALLEKDPDATVIDRIIGDGSIPHIDEDYAISQSSLVDVSHGGSMARSEELIQELEGADILVIGTPMHNLTVPSALKAWLDHVVRARRTFAMTAEGKIGKIQDRPVFIAISSGGRFSGTKARQPDLLTPYLATILGMIGLRNLTFFSVQGTGGASDVIEETRARTYQELKAYFSSFTRDPRFEYDVTH